MYNRELVKTFEARASQAGWIHHVLRVFGPPNCKHANLILIGPAGPDHLCKVTISQHNHTYQKGKPHPVPREKQMRIISIIDVCGFVFRSLILQFVTRPIWALLVLPGLVNCAELQNVSKT